MSDISDALEIELYTIVHQGCNESDVSEDIVQGGVLFMQAVSQGGVSR